MIKNVKRWLLRGVTNYYVLFMFKTLYYLLIMMALLVLYVFTKSGPPVHYIYEGF